MKVFTNTYTYDCGDGPTILASESNAGQGKLIVYGKGVFECAPLVVGFNFRPSDQLIKHYQPFSYFGEGLG